MLDRSGDSLGTYVLRMCDYVFLIVQKLYFTVPYTSYAYQSNMKYAYIPPTVKRRKANESSISVLNL